jgi:tRNA(Ile2) C34 agmatinyltransferase TiaS
MWIALAGYRCHKCGREFMLREPIASDCTRVLTRAAEAGGRHLVEYVMLRRELPCN